jgi:hypothetical protein
MLKNKLFGLAGAIALIGMAIACTPPTPTTAPDSETGNESTEAGEGRGAYSEVPLPLADPLVGTDPEQIALAAFGMDDPGEGNFTQEVTVVEQTATEAVVTLTQTGLLDDSVAGMRYWLEFTAADNQWELVWAGRQVRCQPNRGSQEWSTDLCS